MASCSVLISASRWVIDTHAHRKLWRAPASARLQGARFTESRPKAEIQPFFTHVHESLLSCARQKSPISGDVFRGVVPAASEASEETRRRKRWYYGVERPTRING